MNLNKTKRMCRVAGLAATCLLAAGNAQPPPPRQVLGLDECLKTALENNHRRPASRLAVTMAEAQHRQALAGYWPQVSAKAGIALLDEAQNFIFPPSQISIGPLSFAVPAQTIKLMDPRTEAVGVHFDWLLWDGGLRHGYREQAGGAMDAARAEVRRTDLEIADSVVRIYYGVVLAGQLHQLGRDTLARMETTLELTEAMYKASSGKVNKTDYLENRVMVETVNAMVAALEKNQAASRMALAYTMGLAWNADVEPKDTEVPHRPFAGKLDDLVSMAYQFSPDWAKLEAGLRAFEGARHSAQSAYYPRFGFTGQLYKLWNSYDMGMATAQNKGGWTVGLGLEIPVFNGFLTAGKVAEARARLDKLKQEKFLLREGLGVQIRDLFLGLDAALKSLQAATRAMDAARENRDLTARAYQNELIETEKVIRAQLMEALMSAQFYKARYDYLALESQINVVVGKEVTARLGAVQ